MSGLAGLGSSFREPAAEDLETMPVIGLDRSGDDKATNIVVDPDSGHVTTYHEDGSVEIDTQPGGEPDDGPIETEFNENLAKYLSEDDLAALGAAIHEGVQNDIKTRADFEEIFSKGIDLLGLKMEAASSQATSEGTVSRFVHPLLLETTVKYQANFIAEMLPAAGPVKVRDDKPDEPGDDTQTPNPNNPVEMIVAQQNKNRDAMAEAFQLAFNHFLTETATEFYPDTDRMAFVQGFCGNGFKKQFHCPIRKRPVSESIPPQNLIVSNNATDLKNALRVTHETKLAVAMLRRMQLNGEYLDVAVETPQPTIKQVEQKIGTVEGVDKTPQLPSDYEYTMYETMIDIDLRHFEHRINDDNEYDPKGKPSGLPLPYIVTMERDSMRVLKIKRNWKEGDPEFQKKVMIVHYPLIPGLGFLAYGFVHLLGNTTRALTASTRLLIDAGQFSCFPGFLMARGGSKQNTNDMRVSPGTGKEIDTMGKPIGDIVMKLPYNEPSQALMALLKQMSDDGQRLGGAPQVPVGEGRVDVPVGTMLMAIEQTTKIMGAVHKRNHNAMAQELRNLRDLFIEDPSALYRLATKPVRKWETAAEFADKDLVPASDPNVPSQMHRIMIATGLVQMAGTPTGMQIYNQIAVHERALRVMGISDPGSLFNSPAPAGQPSPEQQAQQAEMQLKQGQLAQKQQDTQVKETDQQRKAQETLLDQHARHEELVMNLNDKEKQRQHDMKIERLRLASEHIKEAGKGLAAAHQERIRHAGGIVASHVDNLHERIMQHGEHQHENEMQARDHAHAQTEQVLGHVSQSELQKQKPQPEKKTSSTKEKKDE